MFQFSTGDNSFRAKKFFIQVELHSPPGAVLRINIHKFNFTDFKPH